MVHHLFTKGKLNGTPCKGENISFSHDTAPPDLYEPPAFMALWNFSSLNSS